MASFGVGVAMDINSIKYFVAAAENRSFTGAARNLYVSQPSISKKIAELESELGLSLFYRAGKTISLTPAGRQLFIAFRAMLRSFDEILLLAKDISSSVSGTLTLGVPQSIDLSRSFPGFFSAFYHDNPGISIRLKYEPRRSLINSFMEGQTDGTFFLSFDAELLQDEMPIQVFALPKGPHRLLYSPFLFPEGFQPELSAFENMTLLIYRRSDDNYNITLKADELLSAVGFAPVNKLVVDSLDALLFYITEGIGVSIAGPSLRIDKSNKIHELPILHEKSLVNLCLCWKESTINPSLLKLTDALVNWKRDNADVLISAD